MDTFIVIIIISMISLFLVSIYACFVVSSKCAEDEQLMKDGHSKQEHIKRD